jgi:hypothetical protein
MEGFTITGYITRGESPDSSNPNEKVVSEHPTYHISYAQPTDHAIWNGYDADYNTLKFVNDIASMPALVTIKTPMTPLTPPPPTDDPTEPGQSVMSPVTGTTETRGAPIKMISPIPKCTPNQIGTV